MSNSHPTQRRRVLYVAAGLLAGAAVASLVAGEIPLMTTFVALFVVFLAVGGSEGS